MKKLLIVCLVLTSLLCVSGCQKTKKEQVRDAIDLCIKYTRDSFDDPTNEEKANKSTEACNAAQSLLNEYLESDEFEEKVYNELHEAISELYENE